MGTSWRTSPRDTLESFFESLQNDLLEKEVSFIEADCLVKNQGAFVSIDSIEGARRLFLSDVVVIYSSRFERSYESCLPGDFSHACFVSGESKTADIEQVLVSGVHGPKECIFVIVQ